MTTKTEDELTSAVIVARALTKMATAPGTTFPVAAALAVGADDTTVRRIAAAMVPRVSMPADIDNGIDAVEKLLSMPADIRAECIGQIEAERTGAQGRAFHQHQVDREREDQREANEAARRWVENSGYAGMLIDFFPSAHSAICNNRLRGWIEAKRIIEQQAPTADQVRSVARELGADPSATVGDLMAEINRRRDALPAVRSVDFGEKLAHLSRLKNRLIYR